MTSSYKILDLCYMVQVEREPGKTIIVIDVHKFDWYLETEFSKNKDILELHCWIDEWSILWKTFNTWILMQHY